MSLKSVLALVLLTMVTTAGVVYYLMNEKPENIVDESICLNYSKDQAPKLKKSFIDGMKQNYFNNQLSVLNGQNVQNRTNLEGGDTQSVWLDLEKLKKFIYHLEIKAQKSNITSDKLGIRLHFMTYPNDSIWNNYEDLRDFDLEKKYRNRMSLILIPTNKIDGKDVDFNFLTNKKLELENYTPNSNKKMMSAKKTSLDEDVFSENHVGAVPPFGVQ